MHPLLGRRTTPEQDREDVLLAKEANFNFIRTSHYPPSGAFLDYCDEYGMYVEEETAVCFVGTVREGVYKATGSSQGDGNFTERYLSQLSEMIDRDRNHPSVMIWSIGNENTYGVNVFSSHPLTSHLSLSTLFHVQIKEEAPPLPESRPYAKVSRRPAGEVADDPGGSTWRSGALFPSKGSL